MLQYKCIEEINLYPSLRPNKNRDHEESCNEDYI